MSNERKRAAEQAAAATKRYLTANTPVAKAKAAKSVRTNTARLRAADLKENEK